VQGAPGPAGISAANETDADHTFAGPNFEKIMGKVLPQGNYVLIATADFGWRQFTGDDIPFSAGCDILLGADVKQTMFVENDHMSAFSAVPMTLSALISVPAGGAEASVWCFSAGPTQTGVSLRLVTLQVGTFF
jgi:hypothetical protein